MPNEMKHTPGPWQVGWGDGSGVASDKSPRKETRITTVALAPSVVRGVSVTSTKNGITIRSDPEGRPIVFPDIPTVICEVQHEEGITLDCHLANARLIAAAPEVTDALDGALDAIVWMSGSGDFSPGGKAHEGWVKVRDRLAGWFAALRKATGETA